MANFSKLTAVFTLIVLPISNSVASVKTFTFEEGKEKESIRIDVPKNWQDAKDLYGVPLFLLGPEGKGARPTLAVTPTGIADLAFDEAGMQKTQNEYKKGREQWLKDNGGTAISYIPYKSEKWGNIDVAHTIGYRYRLDGKEFVEMSYYVFCQKKLYHMKSLMTLEAEKDFAKTMDSTVRSFACVDGAGGKTATAKASESTTKVKGN